MSDGTSPNDSTVARKIITGAGLSVLSNVFTHGFAILSVAFLGRLLEPEDFGIMAIALIFTGLADAVTNRQFELALIRRKDSDASYYDTAFGIALLWGCIVAITIFALSGPAAAFLEEPRLAPVLKVIAIIPLITSCVNPYFVEFERNFTFLPVVATHLISKAGQAIAGVSMALIWGNYWALVAGLIALALLRLIPTWVLTRDHPTPRPRLTHWRYFLRFGGWLSGTGVLAFLIAKSDTALVSTRLGTAATGLYNMGSELSLMATHHLGAPLMRMVYPGLTSVAEDPVRMRAAYHMSQSMILGFMLPLGCGVALIAPEVITVFIGEKWLPAAPVLAALAPSFAISSVTFSVQAVMMVEGATKTMFYRNLTVALVQVPLIILGLWQYGFAGAIGARVIATGFHTYLSLQIAGRAIGAPWWQGLTAGWRSFAACAVMAAVVLGLGTVLGAADGFDSALRIGAIKAVAGAGAFGLTHLGLWLAAGRPDGLERRILGYAGHVWKRVRRRPL